MSRKSYVNTHVSGGMPKELAEDHRELRVEIVPRGFVAALEVQSTLLEIAVMCTRITRV